MNRAHGLAREQTSRIARPRPFLPISICRKL
jgi:hypothetical protein